MPYEVEAGLGIQRARRARIRFSKIKEGRGAIAEDAGQLLASYQEALKTLSPVCVSPGVANTASDVL